MMTEAWRGGFGGSAASSVATRSSPPKRSFDVAFLTGAKDSSFPDNEFTKDDSRASPTHIINVDSSPSYSPNSPASADDSPRNRSKGNRPPSRGGPVSAFTKVFKSHIPVSSSLSHFDIASSLNTSSWPPSHNTTFSAMSSLLSSTKALNPLMSASSFIPPALVPLLSPTSPSTAETLNNSLVEEYIKSQQELFASKYSPMRCDISTSEALSRLRSTMIPPVDAYRLSFAGFPYSLGGGGMGISGNSQKPSSSTSFLTQNSVSSMMPPSLTQLALPAQNVCAKCNISFRMTSDLVYHMRSQHKREADPYVRRRNEKLKCPICAESFRERHHLTRHMTAHQDRAEEKENK